MNACAARAKAGGECNMRTIQKSRATPPFVVCTALAALTCRRRAGITSSSILIGQRRSSRLVDFRGTPGDGWGGQPMEGAAGVSPHLQEVLSRCSGLRLAPGMHVNPVQGCDEPPTTSKCSRFWTSSHPGIPKVGLDAGHPPCSASAKVHRR